MGKSNKIQFSTIMNHDNMIVKDHRVHGIQVMPGVTFLDLIYRGLNEQQFILEQMELRNLIFKEPVITTADYNREIRITIEKESGHGIITAQSRKVRNSQSVGAAWVENFQCELHRCTGPEPERIDIQSLKAQARRISDMDYAYSLMRKVAIHHYTFMKTRGEIYHGSGYLLAELRLDEVSRKYLPEFYLHPAYLDSATLIAGLSSVDLGRTDFTGAKPYIPIYIESFRALDRLNDKCWVFVKEQPVNLQSARDVLYFDLGIYDETGRKVANFQRLAVKRIRSKDLLENLAKLPVQTVNHWEREIPFSRGGQPQPELPPFPITERTDVESERDLKHSIEQELQRMVAELLNREATTISLETGFYDQGLDSANLLQLVQSLEHKLGLELYPTLMFEYSNISELAGYLAAEYQSNQNPETPAGFRTDSSPRTFYYKNTWEQSQISAISPQPPWGPVLIFDTGEELYEIFHETQPAKEAAGQIVLVKPGGSFRDLGNGVYEIDPGSQEDYKRLIRNLDWGNCLPERIIHRWSSENFQLDSPALESSLAQGMQSVFALTRALMEQKIKREIEIIYIYQEFAGEPQPQYAAVAGFAKSAHLENPRLLYKIIASDTGRTTAALFTLLLGEFGLKTPGVALIRYQGNRRLLQRLARVIPENGLWPGVVFKEGGVYLITGGTGGLGLIVAKFMATVAKVRLILVGRSALTPGQEEALAGIKALGSEVRYIKADVAKQVEVNNLIAALKADYHGIQGVIHGAGIIRDALIINKTGPEMAAVIAAKVWGTVHLDLALRDEPLDFLIFFSSTAAVFGNIGQADYAYGNSFMDNYAEFRERLRLQRQRSGVTLSINWPLWQEGGMKSALHFQQIMRMKTGIVPLSTENGISAFTDVLKFSGPQIMVIAGYEEQMQIAQASQYQLISEAANPAGRSLTGRRQIPAPAADRRIRPEDGIAIIGISGRYPMAQNKEEFWENLKLGRDCISEIPPERWRGADYYDADKEAAGKYYCKWGGFMEDIDRFDPLFFNISPREAEFMDPQERLFLEVAWETLEDAGYTRDHFEKNSLKVGVFAGVMWGQYQLLEAVVDQKKVAPISSYASIANRVSFCLNLHGPSVALDTMCSSSLTAIHLACESIRNGESNLAIAGGVNVTLHPNKYLFLSRQKFISSEGRCRSFGAGGDGYVPGEGVGAVLLKPYQQALRDHDHVYAIIRGSAINHGGKSSGYSVPNLNAQAAVIGDALKSADIDPRTISYLEAHGTGTALGDPIEIKGLSNAFQQYTAEKQFCPIGSVKSNIGHLESAAGIAGLCKVVLQMGHRRLVPSLHAESLNANIDFENSPFYLQQNLSRWEQPVIVGEDGEKRYPRRAGISSFGAGGANAHVILEEAGMPETRTAVSGPASQIIVLSARNETQLTAYVRKMAAFVSKYLRREADGELVGQPGQLTANEEIGREIAITDLAYTLQTGREPLEERLALVAGSIRELFERLTAYSQGKTGSDCVFHGNVRSGKIDLEILFKGAEGIGYIFNLMQAGKWAQIAKLWTFGVEIDWESMYQGARPYRIPLPTYPFSQERYWLPGSRKPEPDLIRNPGLHPLIDTNESTLDEQLYTKTITGNEFYSRNYSVGKQRAKIIPGSIYLEMARAAGSLALKTGPFLKLDEIVWVKPLTLSETPQTIRINLFLQRNTVKFELSSGDALNKRVVYLQGRLSVASSNSLTPESPAIDIDNLKKEFANPKAKDDFYQELHLIGIHYESSFQIVQEFWHNQNQALSHLVLTDEDSLGDCGLHPVIMEGALQTVISLAVATGKIANLPYLFFEMAELKLVRALPAECYVVVTLSNPAATDVRNLQFDIKLRDESGRLLVTMSGVTLSAVSIPSVQTTVNQSVLSGAIAADAAGFVLEKNWREAAALAPANIRQLTGRIIILANNETQNLARRLFQHCSEVTPVAVLNGVAYQRRSEREYWFDFSNAEQGMQVAAALLEEQAVAGWIDLSDYYRNPFQGRSSSLGKITMLQKMIAGFSGARFGILHLTKGLQVHLNQQPALAGAELAGLVKMLSAEYHKVSAKTIDLDLPVTDAASISELIYAEFANWDLHGEVCYRGGQRYLPYLKELTLATQRVPWLINPEKVWVVTGGTRGIGAAVARYLADKGARKLVLMGVRVLPARHKWEELRNNPDTDRAVIDKIQLICDLETKGVRVELYFGSLTQKAKLVKFFKKIRESLGPIGGIAHCAGLALGDNPAFIHKHFSEIEQVLEPKVTGLETLHEVFREDRLEFFILFSSVSSLIPVLAAGMSDYAAANAFMNYFAACQFRRGYTAYKSIIWPNWSETGMGEIQSVNYRQLGLLSLTTVAGLNLLEQAMQWPRHVCVMPCLTAKERFGDEPLFLTRLPTEPGVSAKTKSAGAAIGPSSTFSELELEELFSRALKVAPERLDREAPFGDLGVDSVLLAELVQKIERWLGRKLEPSLLIEYPTLRLLGEHLKQLASTAADSEHTSGAEPGEESLETGLKFLNKHRGTIQSLQCVGSKIVQPAGEHKGESRLKVAVIGMACNFPGAQNKDAFWENLLAGKNSISEVPKSRWDIDRYYSSEPQNGKSISKWGGFIDNIDCFDPDYFDFTPEEAGYIDPLIRQFLEISVQTIRDSGYEQNGLWDQRVGVFAGARAGAFSRKVDFISKNSITGSGQNFIAAHVAHFFNFKGPSIVIDSACSSSLVSIHLACQSLATGESDLALAGGVDILFDEKPYLILSEAKALSPDGKCHTFDEKANGFVPGEGCGAVLLKVLDRAIADGDRIYAIIDASAVNNDGHTMGITTPNPDAQREVILEALRKGDISPNTVSLIETHGTGTMIGDPIELKALSRVFQPFTTERQFCAVGSVKTNCGHLLSAAGIASFIKVVLALYNKQIPPTLNCETPNPRFEFSKSPFFPNTRSIEWQPREGIRRAGISSFGFGGTNAHIIVSEFERSVWLNYHPQRVPLAAINFNRRRYWMQESQDQNLLQGANTFNEKRSGNSERQSSNGADRPNPLLLELIKKN
jgi:acyl transferase domain-containing protein/NAD(P)-dependent dehydrogenase (short-subunit alcohol dehydrogenase family)/acyl carrier protein